jgi:hypothetical protein
MIVNRSLQMQKPIRLPRNRRIKKQERQSRLQ